MKIIVHKIARPLWVQVQEAIERVLQSVTLQDLVNKAKERKSNIKN